MKWIYFSQADLDEIQSLCITVVELSACATTLEVSLSCVLLIELARAESSGWALTDTFTLLF